MVLIVFEEISAGGSYLRISVCWTSGKTVSLHELSKMGKILAYLT